MADVSGTAGMPVEGRIAEGSAPADPPVLIGLDDGTNIVNAQGTTDGRLRVSIEDSGDAVSVLSLGADATPNTENELVTAAFGYLFNGTTWDRVRGDTTSGLDVGLTGTKTSGGTSFFKSIDLDETEEEIKATAGQIYWIICLNLATATRFLKIYNATAATVVVGTTVPDITIPIPTQNASANGAGFTISIPNGIEFGTAITVAATTGVADADAGAPGANEVVVAIGYA